MALASGPRLLLLDEPMAGMGPANSAAMVQLLARLKGRLAIVLVEHDMDAVFALADRIAVIGLRPHRRERRAGAKSAPTPRCGRSLCWVRTDALPSFPRKGDCVMLEVSGLEAGYGDGRVLFGVDLAVGAGEVVTLLGRNGMGKTTLSAVMGIVRPQGGTVRSTARRSDICRLIASRRLGLGWWPEGRRSSRI